MSAETADPSIDERERLDAVAKAIYVARWGTESGWDRVGRKPYRKQARAALRAAGGFE